MKKKHSGSQRVAKLRQADVLIGQGKTIPQVYKEIEVSEQTYYRWRQKYGGMSPDMAKQSGALMAGAYVGWAFVTVGMIDEGVHYPKLL